MDVTTNTFTWPVVPLPALFAMSVLALLAILVIIVSRYFDPTGGLLTLSVIIVLGFISATFAALVYDVKQGPVTDILVGALATSVGAIVAFWMSARPGKREDLNREDRP